MFSISRFLSQLTMLDRLLSIKIVELIIIIQSNDNKSMNSIKYK